MIQKKTQFGPYEGKLCDTWEYGSRRRNDRIPLKVYVLNIFVEGIQGYNIPDYAGIYVLRIVGSPPKHCGDLFSHKCFRIHLQRDKVS